ncbi:porin family protein [Sulfurovum sp. bin170]|uniref:outer membrane beta-barrel protein n=1 Tax=Sulfurovum sp. bin170 TaxID=2695268 RepID=UPI0013DF9DA2|nr:outer membrane beta-barrel protein [Sulfurovum sp. bin170]NEW59835.1 porin family protein [Sulfurovum sp. bin170]
MKGFKLSFITVIMLGSLGYAGGEFSKVTAYEIEDEVVAEEAFVEEEPVYVESEPVIVKPKSVVVAPSPVIVKSKDIVTNGFYAGLGITGVRYENDCKCEKGGTSENKDKTYGLMARVGYDFNQYIGIEARGSRTNWDSDGSKVKHAGVFVKPMLPIGNSSNLYGLVGVAKTTVSGRMPTVDAEGLALGVGVEVDLSIDTPKDGKYSRDFDGHGDQEKGVGIFVDYERMHVKSGSPDLDAVSAGVTYDF